MFFHRIRSVFGQQVELRDKKKFLFGSVVIIFNQITLISFLAVVVIPGSVVLV